MQLFPSIILPHILQVYQVARLLVFIFRTVVGMVCPPPPTFVSMPVYPPRKPRNPLHYPEGRGLVVFKIKLLILIITVGVGLGARKI